MSTIHTTTVPLCRAETGNRPWRVPPGPGPEAEKNQKLGVKALKVLWTLSTHPWGGRGKSGLGHEPAQGAFCCRIPGA